MRSSNKDQNFIETINILNKYNIKYWICHATLLGVIRDKDLIPWDHDIDIAVWADDVSEEKIIDIMTTQNFALRTKDIKDSSLHFTKKEGKIVDINFYKIGKTKNNNEQIGYLTFHVPKNFFCKVIEALSFAKTYNGKFKNLIKMFYFFESFFNKFKNYLIQNELFYNAVLVNQPVDLLKEFHKISFYGIEVRIPKKFNEYLVYMYGENWKTPIKNWNSFKDMPNLKR